jgi:phage recombination protein Bet
MTTEIAVRGSSDLAIEPGQTMWTDKQKAALVQLGVKDASNADLAVFFHQATRTGLDPFAKQIYMLGRWTKDGVKQTIQTGIDGYRLIARRAADKAGETLAYADTLWCGEDGQWRDVWLSSSPPAAAKVTVLRGGHPFSAVALWSEFVQTTKNGEPNSMWSRMKANQLAKCAEALALRKAFPQDLSGIYTDDELGQADRHEVPPTRRVTAAEIRRETPKVIEAETVQDDPPPIVEDPPGDGWPEVATIPGTEDQ